jgi:hypothetical protein
MNAKEKEEKTLWGRIDELVKLWSEPPYLKIAEEDAELIDAIISKEDTRDAAINADIIRLLQKEAADKLLDRAEKLSWK